MTIKVKNFVAECDMEAFLRIDKKNINDAIHLQALNYATVALAHSNSYRQAVDIKTKKNVFEGKLDENIRNFFNAGLVEGAPDAKTKTKLTEAQIQAKIQSDPEYISLVNACNEAESYLRLAENMLEAMKQKKDMLILLGKNV